MSTESFRKIGIKTLESVLKVPKNVEMIEKYIYISSSELDQTSYKTILFQVMDEISSGNKLKDIVSNLKDNKYYWNHSVFKVVTNKIREQDEFLLNPFEVEEGVLECHCGSKRVFSYSKQVRSSDEKTTIFAQCVECKKKWKE